MPKGIIGNQVFFIESFIDFYRFYIVAFPWGPRFLWPSRAETAVRLFKRFWDPIAKVLIGEGYVDRITIR